MKKRENIDEVRIRELFNLLPNDVTMSKLKDLFAVVEGQTQPRIPATAGFTLDLGKIPHLARAQEDNGWPLSLCKPTELTNRPFTTTAGRYLANLFLFGGSENMRRNMPYINEPFKKGTIGMINSMISRLLVEGKITPEEEEDYINREQWFSFAPTSFMAPSFDDASTRPIPEVLAARDKMYEDNKDVLENYTMDSMVLYQEEEAKILALAKKKLEETDSGGLDIYESGASGSFS